MLKSFKGYDKRFYAIFFIEIFLIAALRGTQASLLFYLRDVLSIGEFKGYEYLSFLGILAYALPIIAGIISDKYLGNKFSMQFGLFLLCLGYLSLALPNNFIIILALSLIGCGSGLFKPKLPILLGELYPADTMERNNAFSLYYSASSIGTITGTFICGWIGHQFGWETALLYPPVFILCAYGTFKISKISNLIPSPIYANKKTKASLGFIILLFALMLSFLFTHDQLNIIMGFASLGALYIFYTVFSNPNSSIKQVLKIAGVIGYSIAFFMVYAQTHYALNIYVDKYVHKEIFSITIPTTWFLLIEPSFIILGSFFLSNIAKPIMPKLMTRILVSSFLLGTAYLVFYLSAATTPTTLLASPMYIIVSYILIAISELILIPSTISKITSLCPEGQKSSFMGLWFLSMAFAQYLAGIMAKVTAPISSNPIIMIEGFQKLFGVFSVAIFLVSFLVGLGILIQKIKFFYKNKKL